MTAICIKCGAEKPGPLATCRKCEYFPRDVVERVKSIIVSDDHLDPDGLAAAASVIQSGDEFDYPRDVVDQYMNLLGSSPVDKTGRVQSKPHNDEDRTERAIMTFAFIISPHEYEAGSVFDDAPCHGAYIEVGDEATYEWFQSQGLEGNGYTILALVDSLCKLELKDDAGKYEMEAEADNTWVYGREKAPLDRLLAKFEELTKNEAGVKRLIENASDELME